MDGKRGHVTCGSQLAGSNARNHNLVPRASVAFPQKASRQAAADLEQEHKWP